MFENDGDDDHSTFAQPRFDPTAAPTSSFVLAVEEGPDTGASIVVDGSAPSKVLVGQSPVCDLRLTDREVSRRHLALELAPGGLRVTDVGSKNGTLVGDVSIGEAYLRGGERIRIGSTVLRATRGEPKRAHGLSLAAGFGKVLGASREMRSLYPLCERLAATNVPVLVEGETGTGKEVLAESLHELGPRADAPFVIFDCTTVSPSLIESELFGHERGAFTGASSARAGVFEEANGGTILIDEIGDLPLALQPKLLRALEQSAVRRVGGSQWIRFDARVIAATRRDLDREVQEGRFRDDLFHRLAVARIELPPLRARRGDVALLARRFASEMAGDEHAIPSDVLARWEALPWPGNIRQLRNAVAQRIALGTFAPEVVGEADAGAASGATTGAAGASTFASRAASAGEGFLEALLADGLPMSVARQRLLSEFENRYVAKVLDEHGGNVVRAAAASGIARRYFQIIRARSRR